MRRAVLLCALAVGAQGAGILGVQGAGAQLPPIDVPDLPVPELPAPELPAPELHAPELPAPELPSAPAPTVPETPLPAPGLPEAPSAPEPSSASPPPSGSQSSGGSGTASSERSTESSPAVRGLSGTFARTPGQRSSGTARRGSPGRSEPARERRLRRTVRRLAGCLDQLPDRQRRVLVLRAGIGPRPPFSRVRVARRLELPARRVARIERRGLRRLRALGGCGAATERAVYVSLSGVAGASTEPAHPLVSRVADASGTGGGEKPREPDSVVKGAFDAAEDEKPAAVAPPLGDDGSMDLSIVAVLLGLLLLGYAVRRELRWVRRMP